MKTRKPPKPRATAATPEPQSLLTDTDLFLFAEGTHFRLYEKLGAHVRTHDGVDGTSFAVWAPNAERVSVIGDFNGWDKNAHVLAPRAASGVFETFVPGVGAGCAYKFHVASRVGGFRGDKADPFGFVHQVPSETASIVADLSYDWGDREWMETRARRNAGDAPIAAYEVHLGSWQRPDDGRSFHGYREIAPRLAAYVRECGFTHVELLPIMEHPFYGSWGYQVTGYFAPTARYGTPQDMMFLVDHLHQQGIGVILDWVPSHFPSDGHGLAFFDGTHLYEHPDPRRGYHPDWKSYIFDYGRKEVRSFLLSSAHFWLDRYHADALRVDAVASMLYLDYSRKEGEWIPNEHGGRENLEAISLLRELNTTAYREAPGAQTIAEESTAWPMVSRPTYVGGLGFGMKWDMGWMHDTLEYFKRDPIHRKFHHNELTFRTMYAFSENFVLALSHDEVVHGKGSLIGRMAGDAWQKRANLRLLLAWMYAQPGKKLLFMGAELGQWSEWSHERALDWRLLDDPAHAGIRRFVADLNRAYGSEPALHEKDFEPDGFEWIDCNDSEASVLTMLRRGRTTRDVWVIAFNFTPQARANYRIGVPRGGLWEERINSDAPEYGGSGQGNLGGLDAAPTPWHGRSHCLYATLPPLGAVFFRSAAPAKEVR